MALGSAAEMRVWLDFAKRLDYLDEKSASNFILQYIEVSKILRALGKSWHKRPNFLQLLLFYPSNAVSQYK